MPRINGLVYRIQTSYNGGFLFEAISEIDPLHELKEFCAKLSAMGAHITSVTRIFDGDRSTPRVAIMDDEYRKMTEAFIKQRKVGHELSLGAPLTAKLKKLMEDNEENLKTADTKYDQGYAEGFHDAIVDVMHAAGIDTDEEYYN